MSDDNELPATSAALMARGETAVELPSRLRIVRSPGVVEVSWRARDFITTGEFYARVGALTLGGGLIGGYLSFIVAAIAGTPWVHAVTIPAFVALVASLLGSRRNVVAVRVSHGLLRMTSRPFGGSLELVADDIAAIEAAPLYVKLKPRDDDDVWGVVVRSTRGRVRTLVAHRFRREQADAVAKLVRDALGRHDEVESPR